MSNIVIAAQDQFGVFYFQFTDESIKFIQPYILELLPFISTGTTGKICIDESYITKIKLQHATLIITYLMAIAQDYRVGFYFRKNSHAAVSFFLGTEPMMMKP